MWKPPSRLNPALCLFLGTLPTIQPSGAMASSTPPPGGVGRRAAADDLPDDLLLAVLSQMPPKEAKLCEGAVVLTSRCGGGARPCVPLPH